MRLLRCALLALVACQSGDGTTPIPETGSVRVITSTTGSGDDADGFAFSLGLTVTPIGTNDTVTVDNVTVGEATLGLLNIAEHCEPVQGAIRTTTVQPALLVTVSFDLECFGMFAFKRQTSTSLELFYLTAQGDLVTLTGGFTGTRITAWRWSPDGAKLVFAAGNAGAENLFLVNADGTGLLQLTNNPGRDDMPSWSPSGTRIAFARLPSGSFNWDIYAIDTNGQNEQVVTASPQTDWRPEWSPSGARILFSSTRTGDEELWLVDPSGANPVQLTAAVGNDSLGVWSPDGTEIAFESTRDGNREIYVMNANGTSQRNLSASTRADFRPQWAPSGTHVLFGGTTSGSDLFAAATDGSGVTRLTTTIFTNQSPSESNNGQHVLFASNRDGEFSIYVMNADGTNVRRLTNAGVGDTEVAWRPIP